MELGHLLTRSGLTYPEVSSNVCHDSFCQLGNSVSRVSPRHNTSLCHEGLLGNGNLAPQIVNLVV